MSVDAKISEFKAMQTTVVSLLEAPVSVDLIDTTRECINKIDKDLAELMDGFDQFTTKIKEIFKSLKTSASDSGMSHK